MRFVVAPWILAGCRGGLQVGPTHRSFVDDTVTSVGLESGAYAANGLGGFASYQIVGQGGEGESHAGSRSWLLFEPRYRRVLRELAPERRLYAAGGAGGGPTFQGGRVRSGALGGHLELGLELGGPTTSIDLSLRYGCSAPDRSNAAPRAGARARDVPVADFDESEGPEWNHTIAIGVAFGRRR